MSKVMQELSHVVELDDRFYNEAAVLLPPIWSPIGGSWFKRIPQNLILREATGMEFSERRWIFGTLSDCIRAYQRHIDFMTGSF